MGGDSNRDDHSRSWLEVIDVNQLNNLKLNRNLKRMYHQFLYLFQVLSQTVIIPQRLTHSQNNQKLNRNLSKKMMHNQFQMLSRKMVK